MVEAILPTVLSNDDLLKKNFCICGAWMLMFLVFNVFFFLLVLDRAAACFLVSCSSGLSLRGDEYMAKFL